MTQFRKWLNGALLLLAALPALSGASVIGFDNLNIADAEQPLPAVYQEDGFSLAQGTESGFDGPQFQTFKPLGGNPVPGIFFLGIAQNATHVLNITLTSGGLFSFQSIDFRVTGNLLISSFQGCLGNNCATQVFGTEQSLGVTSGFVTINNSAPNSLIDNLRISTYLQAESLTAQIVGAVFTDNIVLTPQQGPSQIPAPASLLLVLTGLAGLAGTRLRRRDPRAPAA